MLRLKFDLQNTNIIRYDESYPITRTTEYFYADFTFSKEWEGMSKFANFSVDGINWVTRAIDIDGECLVPWEVIIIPNFKIKVEGKLGTTILTSDEIEIEVRATGRTTDATPQPSDLRPTDINFYEFELEAVGSLLNVTMYREGGSLTKQVVFTGGAGGSGGGETIVSTSLNGTNLVITTDLRTITTDLSSLIDGLVDETFVTDKIAELKLEIDRNASDIDIFRNSNFQTEAQVNALIAASGGGSVDLSEYDKSTVVDSKDASTLQAAKDYTYSQADIDAKVAGGGTFDPTAYDTSAVVDSKDTATLELAKTYTDEEIAKIDIPSIEGLATETFVTEEIAKIPAVDVSSKAEVLEVFTDDTKTEIKNDLLVAVDDEGTKVTSQDILHLSESIEEDLAQLEEDLGIERDEVSGEITKNPLKEALVEIEEEFDNSDASELLLGIEYKEEAGGVVASVITEGENIGVLGEIQNELSENAEKLQDVETKVLLLETNAIQKIIADKTYYINDVVLVNGIQYKCLVEHTYNITDGFVTTNWEQITFTKAEILALNPSNIQYVDVLPVLTEKSDVIYGLTDIVSGMTTFYNYNGTDWKIVGNTNINLEDYVLKTTLETDYIKKADIETFYVPKSALGGIVSFEIVEEEGVF